MNAFNFIPQFISFFQIPCDDRRVSPKISRQLLPLIPKCVQGTYLSYLRNLILDEHVFIQLKEKRTVSRFYFYKRVGPDFPGETFRVLKEKEEKKFGEYRTRRLVLEAWDKMESKLL